MKNGKIKMLKMLKFIILIVIIAALIYFIRIRLQHNALEITLKNRHKIEDIKQKTEELKKQFLSEKQPKKSEPEKQVQQEKPKKAAIKHQEDTKKLDEFIREHSN